MDLTISRGSGTDDTRVDQPQANDEELLHTITSTPGITRQKTRLGDTYIVNFNGPDDVYNPQNWPLKKKIATAVFYALSCFSSSFASGVLSPATEQIARRFHISAEVATFSTATLFLLGYTTGPFVWAPMSESQGRKMTAAVAMFGFICFGAGSATAKDYQTLCLCRFFQGVMGASPISITASAYADVFDVYQRGYATTLFAFTVFSGPLLAAPLAGFTVINDSLGWRWCAWWGVILGAASLVGLVFWTSESFAPYLLKQKALQLRVKTNEWALHAAVENHYEPGPQKLKNLFKRPWIILSQEPILMLISLYTAFVYALLYTFLTAYDIVFVGGYHFNQGVAGLPFFGLIIGLALAALANTNQQRYYSKWVRQNNGMMVPEWRMPIAITGSIAFPIGLFWFAWTAAYPRHVHWIVPTLSGLVTGYGILMIFMSFFTFLIDVYKTNSASAFAAATLIRSGLAAGFPLFATQMFVNLEVQWATTLLALLAVLLAPAPVLFYYYGERIRMKSRFAINGPPMPTPVAKREEKKDGERDTQ